MKQRKVKGRSISGFLLLDKPQNMSSNQALQKIKIMFDAAKAGHTGSLDPLATGLLPICFGEATKFAQYMLNADKRYFVTAKLGVKTTTGDAEGEVIEEKPVPSLDQNKVLDVLEQFLGQQGQIPPMFSALKHNGQPLYKLAREGKEVDRKARSITIHENKYITHDNNSITFESHCSKGTYVRTLVEDIGNALGCGAHVIELRRLSAGPFKAPQMVTLEQLQVIADTCPVAQLDRFIHPVDSALTEIPAVTLPQASVGYIQNGQTVIAPKLPEQGYVRLFDKSAQFLGLGEIKNRRVAPKRLLKTQPSMRVSNIE